MNWDGAICEDFPRTKVTGRDDGARLRNLALLHMPVGSQLGHRA